MLRSVDLFAGCGGLSKGFENAGYHIVAAFDNWAPALECYRLNFDHTACKLDLSDVETSVRSIESYAPDIIIGGPPCQDFSHAGKRVESTRASLTDSYAQIVEAIRPRYFVMENVDRAQNSNAYHQARTIFKRAGYGLTERVLLASRCGVPQRRKRFFCIGALEEDDGWLEEILESHLLDKEMTVRDYLGDTLDTEFYYRHPRNYNRRAVFSIDEPAPTMRGVNRPIPEGYPGHPKDACPIGPKVRPLTTLERSLIQTFPADYHWTGTKTAKEQMIGNAVPVNLASYVANALREYIQSRPDQVEANARFREWLMDERGVSSRVASDISSRMNRAVDMVGRMFVSSDAYIDKLEASESFTALSKGVQSQIRGAVRQYGDYSQERWGVHAGA